MCWDGSLSQAEGFTQIYMYLYKIHSSFSLSHEHNDPAVLHLVFVLILGHPVTPSNSFKICLAGC